MSIRFLCDENVEEETVRHLENRGIAGAHVAEVLGHRAPDTSVARTASEMDAILVTNDTDFLDRSQYPNLEVFYYPRNDLPAHRVAARIEQVLDTYPDHDEIPQVFFLTEANLP